MLTSINSNEIKHIVQLHRSKWRKEYNQFIAEGLRTVSTIIKAGNHPVLLLVTEENQHEAQNLCAPEIIYTVTEKVMAKVSPSKQAPGILAVFEIPTPPDIDYISQGIALARVSDPGNMGTLIRSCIAFGKHTVVTIGGCDPWNPKVVQASAGTIAQARIYQVNWDTLLRIQSQQELALCALVVSEGKIPEKLDLTKSLLVIGSEAHGIPSEWVEQCAQKLTLPMPGNTESLNAAVAGSIAMYSAWL